MMMEMRPEGLHGLVRKKIKEKAIRDFLMSNELVSVILPIYNVELYLKRMYWSL